MNTLLALAFVGVTGVCVNAQAELWQQCGGIDFSGPTTCVAGATCTAQNDYYSQCVPGEAAPGTQTVPSTPTPTTIITPSGTCLPNSPASNTGSTQFKGINIAGFDFGCDTTGTCNESAAWPPLTEFYGADGAGQMTHFVENDGMNVFRLPVGWQFLTGDVATGTLKMENFEKYDKLVQACLATGASCIIDVHNYARFNGKIIGQGGPSNDAFASLWASIATQYANNPRIIFGVMNEPHDVPDINAWAESVQAAVTAIRNAGATTQLILLPGNNWTSAETFVSNGSADALAKVTNPDGSVTNLIFDVHKYADSDNSGTHAECTTNNISNAFAPLAQWLRCNNRQAFNTEMGGGNTASCVQMICEQINFQNENSDVIIGYVGWAAGNFDKSYVLGETPTESGGTWSDTLLVSSCLAS